MKDSWSGARRFDAEETERALTGLRELFRSVPVPDSPGEAVAMSAEEREGWQYLQSRTGAGTFADADIACLLACAGVDYTRNVRRLLRTWTLEDACTGTRRCAGAGGFEAAICSTAGHIARVYHRWSDQSLLHWLLDQAPTTAAARSISHEALLALLDTRWPRVMRAASGHPSRCRRVAEALEHAMRAAPDPVLCLASVRRLSQSARCRDRDLRSGALDILAHLRRNRPAITRLDRRRMRNGMFLCAFGAQAALRVAPASTVVRRGTHASHAWGPPG